MGAGVAVAWAAAGWVGVGASGWVGVVAAGGALLTGVPTGWLGEVGADGLAVLALYMGGRCLNWPASCAPPPGGAVSSG